MAKFEYFKGDNYQVIVSIIFFYFDPNQYAISSKIVDEVMVIFILLSVNR